MKTAAIAIIAVLLGCSTVGIAPPGDPQGRLAGEFVTAHPTDSTRRGWSDDIFPESASLELMRRLAASSGWKLVGVAVLQLGVHPYAVVTFQERGAKFRAIHTSMYWGSVRGKWVVEASVERGRRTLVELGGLLQCGSGQELEDTLYGSHLVTWSSVDQMVACSPPIFSEEAARLGPPIEKLFAGGKQTYSPVR